MEKEYNPLDKLKVWQESLDFAADYYTTIKSIRDFGLKDQLIRSSLSISSNIAEGFNRYHNKEFRQFLYIALGSCAELETQLEITHELNYFTTDKYESLREKIVVLSKMLRNLIKKL